MAKESVKLRTIPGEATKKKTWWPLVGLFVFGVTLAWIGNHLAGDCLDLQDALRYCPMKINSE